MVSTLQPVAQTKRSAALARDTDSQSLLWLNAHRDAIASLRVLAGCVNTCDLLADGDWRLIVAGLDKKLKVNASC